MTNPVHGVEGTKARRYKVYRRASVPYTDPSASEYETLKNTFDGDDGAVAIGEVADNGVSVKLTAKDKEIIGDGNTVTTTWEGSFELQHVNLIKQNDDYLDEIEMSKSDFLLEDTCLKRSIIILGVYPTVDEENVSSKRSLATIKANKIVVSKQDFRRYIYHTSVV